MSNLSINTTVTQSTTLLPLMYQSMEVLVMDNQALREYLNSIALENPTFEVSFQAPPTNSLSAGEAIHRGSVDYIGAPDADIHGLIPFVKDQLYRRQLPARIARLARYMACFLDENGYLDSSDLDELLRLGVSRDEIDVALETIQSLDPPGVGARNLSECLVLQLKRLPGNNEISILIAQKYLELLAKKRYGRIAKLLHISVADAENSAKQIAGLDPKPGKAYCTDVTIPYIEPDLLVDFDGGQLIIRSNDRLFPKLEVCSVYTEMLNEISDDEALDYLRKKITETRRVMGYIDHRKRTILACGEAIVSLQRSFFINGEKHLECVSLADIADLTGLSVSTVSRAVNSKYLQYKHRVLPMKFFIERSSSKTNKNISVYSAKQVLAQIINEESSGKKLSDRQLAEIMCSRGVSISRRTVAKYRESLGIRNSADR